MQRKSRVIAILCVAYGLWHTATYWTSTLLSFLHWDTRPSMTILHLSYIQSLGSLTNALGAFLLGQLVDTSGPKTVFVASTLLTACYYAALSQSRTTTAFYLTQLFRVGYHFDAAAEMYLATVTTESERTGATLSLGIPTGVAMLLGPILAAKFALATSLRTAELICAGVLATTLVPVIVWALPDTHSVPRLASARLRPLEYWPMIRRNSALREAIVLRVLLLAPHIAYELISRQFVLRAYFSGPNDTAKLLLAMGATLIGTQWLLLPRMQRRYPPRRLLQLALTVLLGCYLMVPYSKSFRAMIVLSSLQTAAYALAFAETSTQLTSAVERTELGKATGLAAAAQWLTHCLVPLYAGHLVYSWHYSYAFYSSAVITAGAIVFVNFCRHVDARAKGVLPVNFAGL